MGGSLIHRSDVAVQGIGAGLIGRARDRGQAVQVVITEGFAALGGAVVPAAIGEIIQGVEGVGMMRFKDFEALPSP